MSQVNQEQAIGLPALEARLKQDLAWLALPTKRWLPASLEAQTQDVVIIGAGMAGLAAAFALRLQGIDAVLYDQAPKTMKGRGPPPRVWKPYARPSTCRDRRWISPHLPFVPGMKHNSACKLGKNWTRSLGCNGRIICVGTAMCWHWTYTTSTP